MPQLPPIISFSISTASFVRRAIAMEIEKASQTMRLLGQGARAFDVPEWMLTETHRRPSWRGLIKKHRRTR